MRRTLTLVVALVLGCSSVWALQTKTLTDSELAAITSRGRMLAEYDTACRHASHAVLALKPVEGVVKRYIARKTEAGWIVAFGRFDEAGDAFLIVYEATQGSDPGQFAVKTFDPPKKDTAFFYFAAKAIQISLQVTRLEKRPYNTYVLSSDASHIYVYVLPAQTVADVYPLGGDVRYLVSSDGANIIETRQLHRAILEVKHSARPGLKLAGGVHGHVVTDFPEDTDVFHVLRQEPPLPETIATRSGVYVVQTDGTIKRIK